MIFWSEHCIGKVKEVPTLSHSIKELKFSATAHSYHSWHHPTEMQTSHRRHQFSKVFHAVTRGWDLPKRE